MEKNLTTGSVFKNLLFFSLPYLLSYFLQTLYGMADLFIIGQFEGVSSTTAISIGSQVMHMLTVMIVGLAMGSTVLIGQAVGAGDKKKSALPLEIPPFCFWGFPWCSQVSCFWQSAPSLPLCPLPQKLWRAQCVTLPSALSAFPLSLPIMSSAPSFGDWETAKVPCILSLPPAPPTLYWT